MTRKCNSLRIGDGDHRVIEGPSYVGLRPTRYSCVRDVCGVAANSLANFFFEISAPPVDTKRLHRVTLSKRQTWKAVSIEPPP